MKDTYGRGKVKFLRWIAGRQGSGYKIMYLWNWKFDLVLIRYPQGSYVDWHKDPVPAPLKHHRINIVVRSAWGGEFACRTVDGGQGYITKRRFVKFRPDIHLHAVYKIIKGERWVISLGWTTK